MRILLLLLSLALWPAASSAVDIGSEAPNFSLPGNDGKTYSLTDYRGKLVVLEWFNDDCPFVRKHYNPPRRNMQELQEKFTEQDVVWLTVISSAPGEQGHVNQAGAQDLKRANASHQTAILLDPEGTVGRAYSAVTTPHMYLIGKEGTLLYQGAIDSKKSTNMEDIDGAQNHIAEALELTMAGKSVTVAQTRPYGCTVKY